MTPEEARKIIGGYATGNLTGDQRQALFEAALDDQELFDSLVKEQELKEVLSERESRGRLLAQLKPRPRGVFSDSTLWRWAAAAGVAFATIAIAVVVIRGPESPPAQAPVVTAMRNAAAPMQPEPKPAVPPRERQILDLSTRLADRRSNFQLGREADQLSKNKVLKEQPAPATGNEVADAERRDAAAAPAVQEPTPAQAAAALSASGATAASSTAPARAEPILEAQKRSQTEEVSKGALSKDADEPLLRYQVLRRSADGSFSEVPRETLFETGDAVRLRLVAPAEAGMIVLTRGGTLVASIATQPGQAYVLPPAGGIAIGDSPLETRLELQFVRSQGNTSIMAFSREAGAKRQEKAKVAGGSAGFKTSPGAIEIILRHR